MPQRADDHARFRDLRTTALFAALHYTGRYKEALNIQRMRATRRGDRELDEALGCRVWRKRAIVAPCVAPGTSSRRGQPGTETSPEIF